MKNKLLKILFLCLVLLTGVGIIYAAGGSDSTGGGSNNTKPAGYNQNTWYTVYAIRVSFVTSKGEKLSSVDFIHDTSYNDWKDQYVFYTNFNNKVSYKKNSASVTFNNNTKKISNEANIRLLSELESKLNIYGFNKVDIRKALEGFDYTSLFDPIFDKIEVNSSSRADFVALLNYLGVSQKTLDEHYDSKTGIYDIFMVFEPVSVVSISSGGAVKPGYYYGTVYELVTLSTRTTNTTYDACSGQTVFCDLVSAFKRLGCSSYLTGELEGEMKSQMGTSTVNGTTFTSSSYFGGLITIGPKSTSYYRDRGISNPTYPKICSSTSVSVHNSDFLNSSGIGIGVAWIGDKIDVLSCDDIIAKNPNLMSNLESIFQSSGLTGIYSRYSSGISIGDKTINIRAFVNECTCYGIYDHYDKNNLNSYFINKGVKPSDYDHIQLYETKSTLIKAKFEAGSFKAYNELIADYSSYPLNVTPWTYEKYVNLECGSRENYWCEHFNDWYTNNKPSSYPSVSTLQANINNYTNQLTTMINKYNLIYYPAVGFEWGLTSSINGGVPVYSYVDNCLNSNPTCDDIDTFYPELKSLSCISINNFDFSAYNKKYNTNINGNYYVSNCGCSNPYNCTPDYNVGNCSNDEGLQYIDSSAGTIDDKYWKNCVFNDYGNYDINTHKTSKNYYDNTLSNTYCNVYCIESLDADFPKGDITVEAGRYFQWGNGTLGNISGSRTCRTESIDYDAFKQDLRNANNAAVDAYLNYKLELAKKKSIDNATVKKESTNCSIVTTPYTVTSIVYSDGTCEGNCNKPISDKCDDAVETNVCEGENCYTKWTKTCYKVARADEYTANSVSVSITYDSAYKSKSWNGTSWCSNEGAPMTSENYYLSSYEKALDNINSAINGMNSCYNWSSDSIYSVRPSVSIDYSDGVNYNYSGFLVGTTQYSEIDTTGTNCVKSNEKRVSCSGNNCSVVNIVMQECDVVQMTRSALTTFTLPDNVYRYIEKEGNKSVHVLPSDNYIDLGISVLPVSYSTSVGIHGINAGDGSKLNLNYSNLGHSNSSTPNLDTILSSLSSDFGKWYCDFYVEADFIPGDIKVEYRLIDLVNPFPDIDASNRNTGLNWCTPDGDCSYDNGVVEKYIYENRNVSDYELYKLEPMYTFILEPTDILNIRKYNNKNSYTSYTGSYDGVYYDYKCNTGTGKTCISDYFTKLLEMTNATGDCVANKYRSYNDPDNFNACRYLNN